MKSVQRHLEIMTTLNENTVTIPMVREMAQRALDDLKIAKLCQGSLYGVINNPEVIIASKSPAIQLQRIGRAVRYRRKWWQLWKRKAPKWNAPLIMDLETHIHGGFDIPWMKKEGIVK